MSKTINSQYQAKKQKLKNFLDLKPEDRKSFLFEKENPDFPVNLISDRLNIGLIFQSIKKFPILIRKEGNEFLNELTIVLMDH